MKINNHILTFIMLSNATTIAGVATTSSLNAQDVYANHEFVANMTGKEEVPPVDTQAIGQAIFVQDLPLNQTIHYFLNVTAIQNATQSHIHSGAQGQNGPVMVTLFNSSSPQKEFLQKGIINATNLEGPMKGKTIPDFIAAMENGSMYVNVHTEQNPKGEIRGQLVDMP